MTDENTFFIVGSERSGTTLLRLMLSHHPRIECAPEFEFLVDRMSDDGRAPLLRAYYDYLATNRVFLPHELEVDETLTYPDLARSFLAQYGARSGKEIVGATCHHHFERLPRIWDKARYIHLLRDGRDVARSCIGMGWAGNVWYGVERWIEAQNCWNRLQDRIPEQNRIEVRYEDLILEPEVVLTRVCEFLGAEFDEAIFDYTKASTYDRPDASLVSQWKRKLTAEELGLLEARIGPMLRSREYEDSGVPPAQVGLLKRLELYLDNRLEGFRFRRERYGLRNVMRSYFARRFGIRGLEKKLQVQRNEIDNRHLK